MQISLKLNLQMSAHRVNIGYTTIKKELFAIRRSQSAKQL